MCAGTVRIHFDRKTGAIRFDKKDIDKDRILELLNDLVGDITNISCPGLDDDADPDGDRQRIDITPFEETTIEEYQ